MVEAVSQRGYAGTTLRELVTLAGVSKSTFYDHFGSKQECFLATFDQIIAEAGDRVGKAYRSEGDFRERLTASLTDFMALVVDDPAAASLTAVESLTLGVAGVEHRERAARAFEALIQQSFDHSPSEQQVSEATVRAIVAGIRGVTYRHLRSGRLEELPGVVDGLVEWALSYQEPDSEATRRAIAASERPVGVTEELVGDDDERPDWNEGPDSRRSRATLTQRERMIIAAAKVAVERGYEALSIPAISGAAGVSNQTFYEHFASKRDAFLAAFEALGTEALHKTAAAFEREEDRPEAIGAGLRAMLEHIAANELFARLAFFELPVAGPVALDRADAMLDSFAAFLSPGPGPKAGADPLSTMLLEAIPSGVWAVIQYEIAHGRRESLPEMAPEVIRIIMAP
jgi:AcrR family transcriptional regulator